MKQSEIIRFISRWRKSWLIRVAKCEEPFNQGVLRWSALYWWALHLRNPAKKGVFTELEIRELIVPLCEDRRLIHDFYEFFQVHGTWLFDSLKPLQDSVAPESLFDALYEDSIGRHEIESLVNGNFNVERKQRGAFYTPFEFARWCTEKSAPKFHHALKIVDPACGSGVFLSAALHYYTAEGYLPSLEDRAAFVEKQLYGFDLDADALLVTRLRLSLEHWIDSGRILEPKLYQRDTLSEALSVEPSFDWVVGNPPWDKLIFQEREFFGEINPDVFSLKTARERRPLYDRLLSNAFVHQEWLTKKAEHQEYLDRVRSRYARLQGGKGHLDKYLAFLEWGIEHLGAGGKLTMILPNAFYGTTSAERTRAFLLRSGWLTQLWGLSNQEKIFDASPGLRFCVLEISKGPGKATKAVSAVFCEGFDDVNRQASLEIPFEALLEDGCRIPELHNSVELKQWILMKNSGLTIGRLLCAAKIKFYQELNMTLDSPRFELWDSVSHRFDSSGDPRLEPLRTQFRDDGYLVVHEKGTFSRYVAWLKDAPRYVCTRHSLESPPASVRPRPKVLALSEHWRLALRATIHASESTKVAATLLPPGSVVGNSALTESAPDVVMWEDRLLLLGLLNSEWINWYASKYVATNLNQHILESLPAPKLSDDAKDRVRICALGALVKEAPQPELLEGIPDAWLRKLSSSDVAQYSVSKIKTLIDELVEKAFYAMA